MNTQLQHVHGLVLIIFGCVSHFYYKHSSVHTKGDEVVLVNTEQEGAPEYSIVCIHTAMMPSIMT